MLFPILEDIPNTNGYCKCSALAQARLGTLEKDLGLKGTEYNTITSILFIVSFLLAANWKI